MDLTNKPKPTAVKSQEDEDDHEDRLMEEGAAAEDGNLYEKRWKDMFLRLVEFQEEHGHCKVPNRYEPDPQLGYWVSTQRRQYRIMTSEGDHQSVPLTPERAKLLEDIGFEWSAKDPTHKSWEGRYEELKDFVSKHGHALVPMDYKDNARLATWVSAQRQEYKLLHEGKSSRLTQDRMQKLSDVGFVWKVQRGRKKRKFHSDEAAAAAVSCAGTASRPTRTKPAPPETEATSKAPAPSSKTPKQEAKAAPVPVASTTATTTAASAAPVSSSTGSTTTCAGSNAVSLGQVTSQNFINQLNNTSAIANSTRLPLSQSEVSEILARSSQQPLSQAEISDLLARSSQPLTTTPWTPRSLFGDMDLELAASAAAARRRDSNLQFSRLAASLVGPTTTATSFAGTASIPSPLSARQNHLGRSQYQEQLLHQVLTDQILERARHRNNDMLHSSSNPFLQHALASAAAAEMHPTIGSLQDSIRACLSHQTSVPGASSEANSGRAYAAAWQGLSNTWLASSSITNGRTGGGGDKQNGAGNNGSTNLNRNVLSSGSDFLATQLLLRHGALHRSEGLNSINSNTR